MNTAFRFIDIDLKKEGDIVQRFKEEALVIIRKIDKLLLFSPVSRIVVCDNMYQYMKQKISAEKKCGVLSLSVGNVLLVPESKAT